MSSHAYRTAAGWATRSLHTTADSPSIFACAHANLPSAPARAKPSGADPSGMPEPLLKLLDLCRGLTTYAVYRDAIRELHPFEGDDIGPGNWDAIDRQIRAAYR